MQWQLVLIDIIVKKYAIKSSLVVITCAFHQCHLKVTLSNNLSLLVVSFYHDIGFGIIFGGVWLYEGQRGGARVACLLSLTVIDMKGSAQSTFVVSAYSV